MDMQPAGGTSSDFIRSALEWRYATKNFDSGRPATDAEIALILEAIRLAPTSQGLQPFHVIVVSNQALKRQMRKAAFNQPQVEAAPHILVFVADKDVNSNAARIIAGLQQNGVAADKIALMAKYIKIGKWLRTLTFSRRTWATAQAYVALGFGLLAAAQMRIDACPMEGFSAGKIAKLLGLPKHQRPVAFLAIGHRVSDDTPHPKYRLPLTDLVTFNK